MLLTSDRIEKLWVQYFKFVAIIRLFVIARHSDTFRCTVYDLGCTIPIPALYFHYAQSAQAYLSARDAQHGKHCSSSEYHRFMRHGYFKVRRSDKYWCSIWTDIPEFYLRIFFN